MEADEDSITGSRLATKTGTECKDADNYRWQFRLRLGSDWAQTLACFLGRCDAFLDKRVGGAIRHWSAARSLLVSTLSSRHAHPFLSEILSAHCYDSTATQLGDDYASQSKL